MKTDSMIFVFGSNLAGIHGAGAAAFAANYRGAHWGKGVGRTGQSYALPTKRTPRETLSLEDIKVFVDEFIEYARAHPQFKFQVTCCGCGLAGLNHKDIAPMFKQAPDNCYFDNKWFPYLTEGAGDRPQHNYWGTF